MLSHFCPLPRYWCQEALHSTLSLFPCDTFCLSNGIRSYSIQHHTHTGGMPGTGTTFPEEMLLSALQLLPFTGYWWVNAHTDNGFHLLASPAQEGLECKGTWPLSLCSWPLGLWLKLEHSISL